MNACLLLAIVLAPSELADTPAAAETQRPLFEINRHVSTLCKRDSSAKSDSDRAAVVYEMTELYRDILHDPRYETSGSLKEYRARLWSRLTQTKKEIQSRLRRENKLDRSADALSESEMGVAAAMTRSLGDQFAMMSASFGGPAGVFSQAGAAGGRIGPPDYGPQLVDLIQRTIQPEFWDIHGGPGTIVYYQPLHCLVVRATSEVHHRLGGVLGAVRDAGQ